MSVELDDLVRHLQERAEGDPTSVWYDVVTEEGVIFAEAELDLPIPEVLKRCYREISNGGFGPGFKLTGLPGGHESSWGDLLRTTFTLREDDECEEGWLPIIDWGCAQFTIVDCDDDNRIVTLYGGDFHSEEYTVEEMLERWVQGFVPDLARGVFQPEEQRG